MPQPKNKPTHIKPSIQVNSKKRGKVETNKVYLTDTSTGNGTSQIHPSTSTFDSDAPILQASNFESSNPTNQNSQMYYDKKRKEVDAWYNLRPRAVDCLLERHAPISRKCIFCQEFCESPIRCLQCSTTYIACDNCAVKDHKTRPLHSLEIWQVCYGFEHITFLVFLLSSLCFITVAFHCCFTFYSQYVFHNLRNINEKD